jgi:His/Glu/Gln/Arg/opine family amino acid ABC transporter permease subunit
MFDTTILLDHGDLIANGLLITAGASMAGIVGGLALAVPLALMKLARRRWLQWPGSTVIETLRNAPFLVVLFLVHFGVPLLVVRLPPWGSGILALTIYGAAYFAEVLRGAFLSVPRGQFEAARALAMSGLVGLRTVVAPQMIPAAVPAARVVAVMLIKESAVLSVITVPELTHAGLRIQAETFVTIEVFTAIALLYWLVTLVVGAVAALIERRSSIGTGAVVRQSRIAARYLTLDWQPRLQPLPQRLLTTASVSAGHF